MTTEEQSHAIKVQYVLECIESRLNWGNDYSLITFRKGEILLLINEVKRLVKERENGTKKGTPTTPRTSTGLLERDGDLRISMPNSTG